MLLVLTLFQNEVNRLDPQKSVSSHTCHRCLLFVSLSEIERSPLRRQRIAARKKPRGYNPRLLHTSTRMTRSVGRKRLLIYEDEKDKAGSDFSCVALYTKSHYSNDNVRRGVFSWHDRNFTTSLDFLIF